MKLRFKALMLSFALVLSSFSMCAFAAEETDLSEQVTEAVSEEESSVSEAVLTEDEELSSEPLSEAEDAEDESEADAEGSAEDSYIELLTNYLVQVDAWTDDQIEAYMDSEDPVTALVALNWNTMKSELGHFQQVTEIVGVETTDSGYGGIVSGLADYDAVSKGGTVTVTLEYEYTYSSTYGQYVMGLTSIDWDVDYTLGAMIQKAVLNTVMGVCIVFLVLAFLSFLISRIHYIPELLDRMTGKNKTQETQSEEAELSAVSADVSVTTDEEELAAVISAAVAAYREEEEGKSASGDSYVVRSIKKINKGNWRRA